MGARAFVAALCTAASLLGAAALVNAAEESPDLKDLREKIEGERERVGRFEREQRALLERLEEIDTSVTELRARERSSAAKTAQAERDARRLAHEARAVEAQLARTRSAMSRRVVALYKAGATGPIELLFSAESLRDFLVRVSALRLVLALDGQLVARHRSEFSQLDAARASAGEAATFEAKQLAELAEARAELKTEREQKDSLLASVRADRAASRALLIELERAARALEETLARLGGESVRGHAQAGTGFEERRGSLTWPVAGRVKAGFGRVVDAEFGTETLRNGVEIEASTGDLVQAVAAGVVRFAGWFRGYGRIAILDHGDGYFSVSGHLDELVVKVGDSVGAGGTLGTAGETGSLSGPSLYFELRQGARPVDPLEWLTPRE